jgi:hypothetical protein
MAAFAGRGLDVVGKTRGSQAYGETDTRYLLNWMCLMVGYWIFATSSRCPIKFTCYTLLCCTRFRCKLSCFSQHFIADELSLPY